jgi:tRNA(fMet)-specific endonuclease VapC
LIYLLDTNACIHLLRSRRTAEFAAIRRRLDECESRGGQAIVCSVARFELFVGALRSRQPEDNLARVGAFTAAFSTLPFDDAAAAEASRIRASLESAGNPIGPMDLLTAAIALAHGATVVTHNTGEFGRVPGLPVEDWQVER